MATSAAERYPDAVDVAKRAAYCEGALDTVLEVFARLQNGVEHCA